MRCLKVAFGMENDETLVDAHYGGDSEFFAIYEVCEDGSVRSLEKRINGAKNFEEEDDGHGDPRKFRAVIGQLLDVDVLAAFRMGPNFLRIRDGTNKVVFFTRTRELSVALQRLLENFDGLWEQVQEKNRGGEEA